MKMKSTSLDNKLFFFLVFSVVGVLSYQMIKPLVSLIVMALILALIFQPVYRGFHKLVRKRVFATPLTLITIFLTFIIPVLIVSIISVNQLRVFINDIGNFAGVETGLEQLEDEELKDEELEGRIELKTGNGSSEVAPLEIASTNEQVSKSNLNTIANTINAVIDNLGEGEQQFELAVVENKELQGTTKVGDFDVTELIDDVNMILQDIPFVEAELTLGQVQEAAGQVAVSAGEFVGSQVLGFVSQAPIFIMNLILFVVILAILLPSMKDLKKYIIKLSPLDDDIDNLYLRKVSAMAVSMVRGTFVIAVVQGIIIGILLFLAGVDYVIFWTLISIFLSFIPNGAAIINWPILIIVALTGNIVGAAIILVGNLLIVANIDGLLRPMLASKDAQLHPALILVGVIGGLQTFGFIGVIYGPVILILLVTTFEVYMNHYKNLRIE